ncbi:MAG: glycosyltransferase family 39 protein [Bacteroidetes bacterium]|nr:glycosyltransferase family 39 protein [Bacteroidota bacterium]
MFRKTIEYYSLQASIYYVLFAIILVAGAFMRFYASYNFSFSNDELGSLMRLNFASLPEVIEQGIKKGDTHPPLLLVFLFFWTKISGTSEFMVRLPFAVAGTLAIFYAWRIGLKWFHPATALLSAAGIAFLEFPLHVSYLIRPYSPGLLFFLMNVYYWTNLLFEEGLQKRKTAILYGVTAALCMYSHYFSFLSALITGLTGFIFLNRKNIKYYLLGGLLAIILYLPSFTIFWHHFFIAKGLETTIPGGDEYMALMSSGETMSIRLHSWLQKPTPSFFPKFIFYAFNSSVTVLSVTGIICLVLLLFNRQIMRISKFQMISLAWFLLPFITGYFYSVYRSAILQEKVLVFSFPFLLLFLFSFFKDIRIKNFTPGISLLISGVFFCSTILEKEYFIPLNFDQFRNAASRIIKHLDERGEKNVTRTVNVSHRFYIEHYLKRFGSAVSFASYRNEREESFLPYKAILRQSTTPFFLHAWTNFQNRWEVIPMIREFYPYTISKNLFFCSEVYLFSREKPANYVSEPFVFFSCNTFDSLPAFWSPADSVRSDSVAFNGKFSASVDPRFPFSPTFSCHAETIFNSVDDILYARVTARMTSVREEVKLCISFEDTNGIYSWHDILLYHFIDSAGKWDNVYLSTFVPRLHSKSDHIRIFVWNLGKVPVHIDNFTVWVEKGNPVVYGKRKDRNILSEQ